MQSVSPRTVVWERVQGSMSGGRWFTATLVILLAYVVAKSTSTFHWVDGTDAVTPIVVLAAVLLGALAISPLADAIGLGIGVLAGFSIAAFAAWPQIHLRDPEATLGLQLIPMWWQKFQHGTLISDYAFFLFLICVLMWVAGGWLAWSVLRWRKPMLGLIPGAAAFATNVLNISPGDSDQNGYTLAMLVLTIALLLWTNYTSSIADAVRAKVKLTGDARWDFWESGLVAMTALIVLGIFLPPLSNSDRTADAESGMFASWAQLQQQLSHPGIVNFGHGGGRGTTGFTESVQLSGSLQRTREIVFTYTVIGENGGPKYFRGIDITDTIGGEWRYLGHGSHFPLSKNQQISYPERYDALGIAGFAVRMQRPPNGYPDVLFYPGQLLKIDRVTSVTQVSPWAGNDQLVTVDRLSSIQPPTSGGPYTVYSYYSDATEDQLRKAPTNYPDWVKPFAFVPRQGYRSPAVLARIHDLALAKTAGYTNPYDKAAAIERYLRSSAFHYSLTPPDPGVDDRIDNFLFKTQTGYCEYFATAMGDMLRSLGIPTRLVNGYGQGQFDSQTQNYVVRGEDAHTWVEVYFPNYGWIPFEPTTNNAGVFYDAIVRGQTGSNLCLRDAGCEQPIGAGVPVGGGAAATPHSKDIGEGAGTTSVGGPSLAMVLDANNLTKGIALLIAILLLSLAATARYLRPHTVMAAWKRMLLLAGLAGAERKPGETPLELGRRLQRTFPEAAEPVDALTKGFVVAAYAPPDEAATSRPSVLEAWTALRPMLLRRVLARLRPTRLN